MPDSGTGKQGPEESHEEEEVAEEDDETINNSGRDPTPNIPDLEEAEAMDPVTTTQTTTTPEPTTTTVATSTVPMSKCGVLSSSALYI